MITSFFKKKGPAVSTTPKREREGSFEDKNAQPFQQKRRSTKDSTGTAIPGGESQQEQQNNKNENESALPLDVQELVKCLNHCSEQSSEPNVPCDKALDGEEMENIPLTKTEVLPKVAWRDALDKHIASPSFARLAKFVAEERKSSKVIYPPVHDTFSALNLTPLDQVKVVIVGQDPYHGPNQAHGLCFSVRKGVRTPPSLLNIYKELLNDSAVKEFTAMPSHGFLEHWAKQGVLMINNVLTVRQGDPNSHAKKGWEAVTDEIIRAVDRASVARKTGVVFLLWGNPATVKAQTILQCSSSSSKSSSSSSRHKIICTSHPSPLGASKTKSPFMGSKCFSRANEALKELGHEPIDWRVDGEA